jgi:plasmid stabilization system protein ParE
MTDRYILSPEAARDLVAIWRYIKKNGSTEAADKVESVILGKIAFLAESPGRCRWPVFFMATAIWRRPWPNGCKLFRTR